MDWSNEDYVRLYTRETSDDLMLSWEAIALWRAMLCRFDRSGLIDTKRGHRGLAALVRMPPDVVERVLTELIEDGRVEAKSVGYFAPNFMEAQTATKSDKQRQKEARERRNANARAMPNVTGRDSGVTKRDETSRAVTSGHERSQPVTLTSADPCLASEDLPLPRAIPPTAAPEPTPPVAPVPILIVPVVSSPCPREDLPAGTQPAQVSLDDLWSEFELERQRVAKLLRIELLQLAAHDRGRADLAHALAAARSVGDRDREVARIRHVIAVAGAEAEGAQDTQWLSGAAFTVDNLRRMSSTTAAKAKQAAADKRLAAQQRAARANGSQPSIATTPRKPDPPPRPRAIPAADLAGPADFAAALAHLGIEARAGPAPSPPTDSTDEQPPAKAAT